MKKKILFSMLASMLFAFVAAFASAPITGFEVVPTGVGLTVLSFVPTGGVGLFAGIYREIWTGEVLKEFGLGKSFLQELKDYSRFVENDVIHLVKVGAKPAVLINNSTYPLTPQSLTDADIPIALDKFETEPTAITDDELYAISYKKIKVATELHKEALEDRTAEAAAHALAPASHSADTPIIRTTGDDNGDGEKRLVIADIISLKKAFDDAKIPIANRVLILSTQHVQDLLLVDESFKSQYKDIQKGQILTLFGFRIYEFLTTPVYDASFEKKAFGAAPAGTDRISSVAFYAPETFKAKGSLKSYFSEASKDVLNKQNLVSFTLRYIALPKDNRAIGAIVNDSVA